ncbi:hypothetical protein [Paracoccus sp. N5]|uniref:hypothetical protein n=1 Tax=Paracoccus sp. N5 TaxID=1101189 RepID=UPI00037D1F96|nr:hypothetical protein [Paracoccus sp. N5]
MSAERFRLILAICLIGVSVAVMGAVNPLLLVLALLAGCVWLLWRLARWAWQRFH